MGLMASKSASSIYSKAKELVQEMYVHKNYLPDLTDKAEVLTCFISGCISCGNVVGTLCSSMT